MSKTYRQPNCREDWQDITKLRSKDADDKIVAVFFIDEIVPAYEKPVIVVWQCSNYLYTSFVNMNGECELAPHRSVVIEIEIPTPNPDAKTIMKIMLSDFAVAYKPWSDCWVKIIFVNTREKIFQIGTPNNCLKFCFWETKQLLFSRDGETILTYDQVVEELNNE